MKAGYTNNIVPALKSIKMAAWKQKALNAGIGIMAAMKKATEEDKALKETLIPHLFKISATQFSSGIDDFDFETVK